MSNDARIRIAGLVTALFIVALVAAGVALRADHRPQAAAAAPAASSVSNTARQDSGPSFTFEELDDD